MRRSVLPNGITVISDTLPASDVVSLLTMVKAGSIHEPEDLAGIAHFTEHMLFKGTAKRAGAEIDREIERLGAEFNAYTSFETTTYDIVVLREFLAEALEVMTDAVFGSTFPESELATERDVILEEIKRYRDNPNSILGQRLLELTYDGTPFARPILGTEESVGAITCDNLRDFHHLWYNPSNVAIYAAGAVDHKELVRSLLTLTQQLKPQEIELVDFPAPPPIRESIVESIPVDHADSRVEVAFESYHPDDLRSPLVDVCLYALTGLDDSPLIRKLRDEFQLVSYLGGSAFNTDCKSIATLSFMPYGGKEQDALSSLQSILVKDCVSSEFADLCMRTKALFRVDRMRNTATSEGRSRLFANADTCARGVGHEDWYYATIDKANELDFLEVIRGVFCTTNPVVVSVCDKSLSRKVGLSWPSAQAPVAPNKTTPKGFQTLSCDISPGLKLIYQYVPGEPQFSITGATEGGVRADPADEVGQQFFIGSLLGRANTSYDYLRFSAFLDSFGASVEGFSGKDSLGLSLNCQSIDAERMLPHWLESLIDPVFPEQQLTVLKKQCLQSISLENDDAGTRALQQLRESIYGCAPYSYTVYGKPETFTNFESNYLAQRYRDYRDSGPWVLCGAGGVAPEVVLDSISSSVATWQPNDRKRLHLSTMPKEGRAEEHSILMGREQTHIVIGRLGLCWQDEERYTADVLSAILGGSSGRLFERLRNAEGLVYSVSPIVSHAVLPGIIGFHAASSPRNAPRVRAAIGEVCEDLVSKGLEKEELLKGINQIRLSHALQYEPPDARVLTMALMEIYGIGYLDYETYLEKVKAVNAASLKAFAERFLDPSSFSVVTAGPHHTLGA